MKRIALFAAIGFGMIEQVAWAVGPCACATMQPTYAVGRQAVYLAPQDQPRRLMYPVTLTESSLPQPSLGGATLVPAPTTTVIAPAVMAPTVIEPAVVVPQVVPAPRAAFRPVLPVAPVHDTYYYGQGLLGQPKLYVPGQPVRNFLRYLGP